LAYITNYSDGTVSVVNPSDDTVDETLTAGFGPYGVVATANRVYVTNLIDSTVSVFDRSLGHTSLAATVTIPFQVFPPAGLKNTSLFGIDVEGSNVFVADCHIYQTPPGSDHHGFLWVFDETLLNPSSVPVGNCPTGVAAAPTLGRVYVTNAGDGTVSVVDSSSFTVTDTVPVGAGPSGLAVTPDGTHVYVANVYDNTVSVIDTATNLVATVPVDVNPFGVAVASDGSLVYVTNRGSNTMSVIATATNTVIKSVDVGSGASGVATAQLGSVAVGDVTFVANSGDNTVSRILGSFLNPSFVVANPLAVGSGPIAFGKFMGSDPPSPLLPVTTRQVTAFSSLSLSTQVRGVQLLKQLARESIPPGDRQRLISRLRNVQDKLDRGSTGAAANALRAFQNEIRAQSGKAVSSSLASDVISLIDEILASI
jgi:YVTN family beta-propeller protein